MKTYNIELRLHSGTLTPFQADTVFGHLCWVVAHREGERGIKEFLKPFIEGKPPFILTDGFPGNSLPRPFSAEFSVSDPVKVKEVKKIEFVSLSDFNRIRNGEYFELTSAGDHPSRFITTHHNTVSRLTNTTSEGGLYSLKEMQVDCVSIYLKAIDDQWKDRVIELLGELSRSGYGRKKSIGKGQFSIETEKVEEFDKFESISRPDGFVTLSNFCPAENDPIEGLYKTFVKYGKLGEEFTFSGNPFKKPLMMIRTGSVFKTGEPPEEFYGRIVQDGIAPAKQEVVQYAYGFALPIRYPKL